MDEIYVIEPVRLIGEISCSSFHEVRCFHLIDPESHPPGGILASTSIGQRPNDNRHSAQPSDWWGTIVR